MQAETLKRVTDYIDTLKSSGAPHQQELANDLSEIIGYYKQPAPAAESAPDDRDGQIAQLKANVSQLMDERDEARDKLAKLQEETKGHGAAKNVKDEEHVSLKSKSKHK